MHKCGMVEECGAHRSVRRGSTIQENREFRKKYLRGTDVFASKLI